MPIRVTMAYKLKKKPVTTQSDSEKISLWALENYSLVDTV
jgi:hypothetical protein